MKAKPMTTEPSFKEIKDHLLAFNIAPDNVHDLTDVYTWATMCEIAKIIWNKEVSAKLADFFKPMGEPVNPGIEDTLSHAVFLPFSWDEFEKQWLDG